MGKIHYKWSFSIAMLNYQRVFMQHVELGIGLSVTPAFLSCINSIFASVKLTTPFFSTTNLHNIEVPKLGVPPNDPSDSILT